MQTDDCELAITETAQSVLATTIPGVTGTSSRKKWDITGLAQSWVTNPTANNGFAILASSPNRDIFCSSEHLSESSRPKLVIAYSNF